MDQCGCKCHTDEHPRYAAYDGIQVCEDCLTEPCETVLEEERLEAVYYERKGEG